jgi:hypothetical protein
MANYKTLITNRDNNKCYLCGTDKNLEVHHITSRKDGGDDDFYNLITLCRNCHRKDHKRLIELRYDFYKYTEKLNKPDNWLELIEVKYKSKSYRLDDKVYKKILKISEKEHLSKNRLFYYLTKLYDKHGMSAVRKDSGGEKTRQTNRQNA